MFYTSCKKILPPLSELTEQPLNLVLSGISRHTYKVTIPLELDDMDASYLNYLSIPVYSVGSPSRKRVRQKISC